MAIKLYNSDIRLRRGRRRAEVVASEHKSRELLVDALVDRVRARVQQTETSTLRTLMERLHTSEAQIVTKAPINPLVDVLTQGRQYDPDETLLMELELQQRGFELRRKILSGALTTIQVAELLGTKRQTPHDRLKSGSLLGIEENGRWLFPYWQFDPAGPNCTIAGLIDTLRALDASDVAKANWLTTTNLYLDGRTPIQALKDGDRERVVDIALAVGAN